ncbi:Rrf2 family transcriptional regulator [Limibacter armeniacum]|uniref:RrF2 family transcriptional regulator n=1 Tax=Limibacter armeniacum TaxID=466084 RepID=UPI002FE4FBC5
MFSKACEYGIRAMLFITTKSIHGERTSLKAISKEIGSPEAFTAKILQQLTKNKVLQSVKGPNGGFEVRPEDASKTKLIEIVSIIDGDQLFTGCGLGLPKCNDEKPCPLHHSFLKIRNDIQQLLSQTSLEELALDLDKGLSFLKR